MAVREAIHNARKARGTNDADNDWLVDVSGTPPSGNTTTEHATTTTPVAEHEVEETFITMGISSEALDHAGTVIGDQVGTLRTHIALDDRAAQDSVLDEISWQSKLSSLSSLFSQGLVVVGLLIHPGITFTKRCRDQNPYGNPVLTHAIKRSVREETCIAMRMLDVITAFIKAMIPWMIMMPVLSGDPVSLFDLPDFEHLRHCHHTHRITYNGIEYDWASSHPVDSQRTPGFDAILLDLIRARGPLQGEDVCIIKFAPGQVALTSTTARRIS